MRGLAGALVGGVLLLHAVMTARAVCAAEHPEASARVPLAPIDTRLGAEDRQLPIDYGSAIRLAAAKNLDILQARARLAEAQGAYAAAGGALLPSLSGSLVARRIDGEIQASFGELERRAFSTINPGGLVSLRLNPGQAIFDLLAAHKRVGAGRFAEEHVTQDTLARVAVQYFELQRAMAQVGIATSAVATAKELERLADDRLQLGVGLEVDAARARARLARDEVALASAEEGFRRASVDLAETLQLEPALVLMPVETEVRQLALVNAERPLAELTEQALATRPERKAAQLQLRAAEDQRTGVWWKALGPEVYGAFEESAIGRSFDVDNRQIYGGFVGWTLAPSAWGATQVAAAHVRQVELLHEQIDQAVKAEVVRARDLVRTAGQRITSAARGVAAAEQSLTLSRDRFEGGVGLEIEVLEAQEAFVIARTALLGAVVESNTAQVRLLRATGEVSETALAGPAISPQ